MNPLRQSIKWAMTSLLPRQRWLVHGPRTAAGIALTFDDGPHPEYTPRLLDELQRNQVKATFFVVGQAAERYPRLVRRMAAEGHVVGTHSYTHSEPHQTSPRKLLDEVRRSLELCGELIGTTPTLFRPPKGQLSFAKTWKLWKLGQTIVLWDQDPRDYQSDQSQLLKWCEQYQPRSGDIVLLHDTHPHCISAIEPLVRAANSRKLGPFVRVDDWTRQNVRQQIVRPQTARQQLELHQTVPGESTTSNSVRSVN